MVNLWTRGGLSWPELIRRTWHETWEDSVFGQAARLAFYHFMAIFPSLLLLLFLLVKLSSVGSDLRDTVLKTFQQILPHKAASIVQSTFAQLNATAGLGIGAGSAAAGAVWAAVNGTWAIMTGLNTAYEVEETRGWWKEVRIAFVLSCCLAVMLLIALLLVLYGSKLLTAFAHDVHLPLSIYVLFRCVEWLVIAGLLLFSFALLYRFGPNMQDRQWQWSTPGALLALILWIGMTLLLREYFELFHSYERIYGDMAGVAMLLLWLYLTSAAILIGGEMNSEIEKAARKHGPGKPAERDRKRP